MDLYTLSDQLKGLSDMQLEQAGASPDIPPYLLLAERKRREAARANYDAAREAPPPAPPGPPPPIPMPMGPMPGGVPAQAPPPMGAPAPAPMGFAGGGLATLENALLLPYMAGRGVDPTTGTSDILSMAYGNQPPLMPLQRLQKAPKLDKPGAPQGAKDLEPPPSYAEGGIVLSPTDRDYLIRTIYGEAGNEPYEGQAGVAAVILNRARSGKYGGNTVQDVVLAKNQFEPWNNAQARSRMLSLDPSSEKYQKYGSLVDEMVSGKLADPTGGATHFANVDIVKQRRNGDVAPWMKKMSGSAHQIGRHTFFGGSGGQGKDAFFADLAYGAPAKNSTARALDLTYGAPTKTSTADAGLPFDPPAPKMDEEPNVSLGLGALAAMQQQDAAEANAAAQEAASMYQAANANFQQSRMAEPVPEELPFSASPFRGSAAMQPLTFAEGGVVGPSAAELSQLSDEELMDMFRRLSGDLPPPPTWTEQFPGAPAPPPMDPDAQAARDAAAARLVRPRTSVPSVPRQEAPAPAPAAPVMAAPPPLPQMAAPGGLPEMAIPLPRPVPDAPMPAPMPTEAPPLPGGLGALEQIQQLAAAVKAQRGEDPYEQYLAQQLASTQAPVDTSKKDKWLDLARFGFALAGSGTGNFGTDVGRAGLAMLQGVDERSKRDYLSQQDADRRRAEIALTMARARSAAEQGDIDTASKLYYYGMLERNAQIKARKPTNPATIVEIKRKIIADVDRSVANDVQFGLLSPEEKRARRNQMIADRMNEAGVGALEEGAEEPIDVTGDDEE